jgi:hypothetical protein
MKEAWQVFFFKIYNLHLCGVSLGTKRSSMGFFHVSLTFRRNPPSFSWHQEFDGFFICKSSFSSHRISFGSKKNLMGFFLQDL